MKFSKKDKIGLLVFTIFLAVAIYLKYAGYIKSFEKVLDLIIVTLLIVVYVLDHIRAKKLTKILEEDEREVNKIIEILNKRIRRIEEHLGLVTKVEDVAKVIDDFEKSNPKFKMLYKSKDKSPGENES